MPYIICGRFKTGAAAIQLFCERCGLYGRTNMVTCDTYMSDCMNGEADTMMGNSLLESGVSVFVVILVKNHCNSKKMFTFKLQIY